MVWKNWVRGFGFGFWLIAATFAAASLTAWHSVALPVGNPVETTAGTEDGRWHMVHYLSSDCACSREVANYLVRRRPLAGVMEEVVLIASENPGAQLKMLNMFKQNGFRTSLMAPDAAANDAGVEGVPLLQIRAPDGSLRFRGGYREHGAPPDRFLDISILSGLMNSRAVPRPRVYGCATTHRLRALLDPLSLKVLSRQ